MPCSLVPARLGRFRVAAAVSGSGLMLLSLSACAGETVRPAQLLSRAFDTNLSLNAAGGPPIAGNSTAGSYLVGRFALETGDYREAADQLDRALAADPGNVELRRQIFLLRLASGDYPQALAAAKALVEVETDSDEALLLLALERIRAQDYRHARDLLQKVSDRGAAGLVTPVIDAWAAYGSGDAEAGLTRLGTSTAEQGLDLLRRYHRALMLTLAGRAAEALTVLEGLEEGSALPPPLRVVQTLAQARLNTGDKAGAARTIEAAMATDAESPQLASLSNALERGGRLLPVDTPAGAVADALIGVSEALLDQQAAAQALLLARYAAYVAPELADTKLLVGRVLLEQGNAAGALDALKSVPKESTQSWTGRLLEAQALRQLDRTDDAARLLRAMAAEQPERIDALVGLGDLYRQAEDFAKAEAAYGDAIARIGTPRPRDWRLFYARGTALERLKRWPEAEAVLKQALELQPEQPLVLNYLGYSWVDQSLNLDEAKRMLNRAVELKPDDGFIVDSLGWAYYRLGEYANAVQQLERAAELEPGDPVINDHLGDAYWRVGRLREARFQWQRALSFKPEPDVASQIAEKLERGLPATGAKSG
jgi:tetratricopeptide (TPR) repeat protein